MLSLMQSNSEKQNTKKNYENGDTEYKSFSIFISLNGPIPKLESCSCKNCLYEQHILCSQYTHSKRMTKWMENEDEVNNKKKNSYHGYYVREWMWMGQKWTQLLQNVLYEYNISTKTEQRMRNRWRKFSFILSVLILVECVCFLFLPMVSLFLFFLPLDKLPVELFCTIT